MDWIVVKEYNSEKVLINVNAIMSISYHKETDLTMIEFIRAAYSPVYVKGDITIDIRRLLTSHGNYVTQIGG